jgi:two-component system sensor histidine kinase UhpB
VTDDREHLGGRQGVGPEFGLYARVFAVNAFILILAFALLALTPIQIDPRPTQTQLEILLAGLLVMLAANAVLLRISLAPLRRLTDLMRTADLLRPGSRLRASGSTEIASVITAFNATLERLESERRSSTERVISAQEAERRRIAQELHDQIGQNLTAVMLDLKRVQRDVPPSAVEVLADAQELTRESLAELQRISYRLRPSVLDDFGLASALATLCHDMSARTEIAVDCSTPASLELSPGQELAFYRVAQEAITNAIRHSGCSRVSVVLSDTPDAVVLVVSDNGRGIHGLATSDAGLRGMRERAVMIGATLTFLNRPEGGLEVRLVLSAGRQVLA